MEGKGPYRIYDPGGSDCQVKDEASSLGYRQLLEENSTLRERMKGLKSLGDLLEESQTEAAKLRKRVEELVRDNEALKSSTTSFASSLCMGGPVQTETHSHGKHHGHPATERQESRDCLTGNTLQPEATESSSEFEVVNMEEKTISETQTPGVMHMPQENVELASQLRRLESSFSVFAEESNPNQLLAHLGRMAVEFHHLSSKVQKNEQRTSLLQTLCEQLRQENSELRKKMEEDLQYRNRDLEQLRLENLKLKEQVGGAAPTEQSSRKEEPVKEEAAKTKVEMTMTQQSGKAVEKTPSKTLDPEVYEKKIKLLEKQRRDVLEVNKQWDIQWNSMKTQFEQKITDLRQRLADSQKAVLELEAEREQKQRDYDKKLLLAKSKIDNVQGEKECLTSETCELKQKVRYLQDQLLPLTKQTEYQEKEIQRLNRALEEALNLHSPSSTQPGLNLGEGVANLRQQELHTQIAVLKEQVKIFEEDFRKERSDRERMNEEKEDLRRQVERLQGQMTNLTNQLHQSQNECQRERAERCKLERLQMQHKQEGQQERRTSDPTSGTANGPMSPPYCGPFVQVGHQGLEGWPIHFPPRMSNISTAPGRDFQPVNPGFPWQTSFPQPRGSRGQADTARPPPETAEMGAAGFGKRERQNNDPGKH
ncbi:TNFAIP3-interacting protein 1-like isoform X1 [Myxocyprinus asiaticus]|uniref:TNFAIP3-interacting protein 1-like isoform X1 n=1 Tax=Myxocyprinus asiaticus TaxID=70543 RepID=UPI002221972A|nr:TNFAIP3-interacting protein 1-like isoform X1 [Myxocyprinus asiaticus]XP_051505952.1 TNFAIP3-interacting protein 1-like isoform X1 [Myxocyprinus asiaticus]XP_051505953.1 TNFAIP3-interacting protein 1-like isoform X1 [Myxocyprinus asiaticus]